MTAEKKRGQTTCIRLTAWDFRMSQWLARVVAKISWRRRIGGLEGSVASRCGNPAFHRGGPEKAA